MNKKITLLMTLMGFALSIPAQELVHVHGKVKILISQQKIKWHIQPILAVIAVTQLPRHPAVT